eukprot:8871698-Pyramimonas_sp.AAC.1
MFNRNYMEDCINLRAAVTGLYTVPRALSPRVAPHDARVDGSSFDLREFALPRSLYYRVTRRVAKPSPFSASSPSYSVGCPIIHVQMDDYMGDTLKASLPRRYADGSPETRTLVPAITIPITKTGAPQDSVFTSTLRCGRVAAWRWQAA